MNASSSYQSEGENGDNVNQKQGLVTQVCREWLVHEDSALAYKLQEKEIELHYGKNREQRKLIQTDLKQAKTLQEDVLRDIVYNEIERDAHDTQLALQLQEKLEREESLHHLNLEKADKKLAKKLQEAEALQLKKTRHREHGSPVHELALQNSSPKKNLATCYEDTLVRATKNMSVEIPSSKEIPYSSRSGATSPSNGFSLLADIEKELDVNLIPSIVKEDGEKLIQEVKDQELALALQKEETNPNALQYYLDQKLAIEAQDHELAILLQEKERHKARKARQKQRLQKSKTQDEQEVSLGVDSSEGFQEAQNEYRPKLRKATSYFDPHEVQRRRQEAELAAAANTYSGRGLNHGLAPKLNDSPRRRQERVEPPLQRSPNDDLPNVAMMLDPTYRTDIKSPDALPQPSGIYSPGDARHTVYQDDSSDDEYSAPDDFAAAPPYMPIQGQKRQTLEKKKKKDNCKQQ